LTSLKYYGFPEMQAQLPFFSRFFQPVRPFPHHGQTADGKQHFIIRNIAISPQMPLIFYWNYLIFTIRSERFRIKISQYEIMSFY